MQQHDETHNTHDGERESSLVEDRSLRYKDTAGRLRIERSNISKAAVNPYMGSEIPGWKALGLNPARVYHMYRPGEELSRAASSFAGVELLAGHSPVSSSRLPRGRIIGHVGDDVRYDPPFLTAPLVINDEVWSRKVQEGELCDLSCGYDYTPEMVSGFADGMAYDGIMRDIRGNHVALVRHGRAGPEVKVADYNPFAVTEKTMVRAQNFPFGPINPSQEEQDRGAETFQDYMGQDNGAPLEVFTHSNEVFKEGPVAAGQELDPELNQEAGQEGKLFAHDKGVVEDIEKPIHENRQVEPAAAPEVREQMPHGSTEASNSSKEGYAVRHDLWQDYLLTLCHEALATIGDAMPQKLAQTLSQTLGHTRAQSVAQATTAQHNVEPQGQEHATALPEAVLPKTYFQESVSGNADRLQNGSAIEKALSEFFFLSSLNLSEMEMAGDEADNAPVLGQHQALRQNIIPQQSGEKQENAARPFSLPGNKGEQAAGPASFPKERASSVFPALSVLLEGMARYMGEKLADACTAYYQNHYTALYEAKSLVAPCYGTLGCDSAEAVYDYVLAQAGMDVLEEGLPMLAKRFLVEKHITAQQGLRMEKGVNPSVSQFGQTSSAKEQGDLRRLGII